MSRSSVTIAGIGSADTASLITALVTARAGRAVADAASAANAPAPVIASVNIRG